MSKLQAVLPDARWRDEYLAALAEEPNPNSDTVLTATTAGEFPEFVQKLLDIRVGKNLPEGYVPATTLWLVDGDRFIGRVSVRHELNQNLKKLGGHIGYWIRPSERGKGYGKQTMPLAVKEARRLGLRKVLLTCDEDNEASRKLIERAGGVFENKVSQESKDVPKLRYWIDLAPNSEETPELKGTTFRLRPIKESDIDERLQLGKDPEAHRMYGGIPSEFEEWTPDSQRAWFDKEKNNPLYWVIEHNGKYGGIIQIHKRDPIDKKSTVALVIDDTRLRGKGIGSEAIRLVTDWAFREGGFTTLRARVLDFNPASIRAFEKAGYREYTREPVEIDGKHHADVLLKASANEAG